MFHLLRNKFTASIMRVAFVTVVCNAFSSRHYLNMNIAAFVNMAANLALSMNSSIVNKYIRYRLNTVEKKIAIV